MKKLILATILTTFINAERAYAQDPGSPLLITSHEVRIRQTTRDEREDEDIQDIITFFYDVTEKMEIKNISGEPYTKTLNFVTQLDDDDPEDLKIEFIRGNGEKKSEGIEFAIDKEGKIFIEFKEENITEIKPEETIQLNLEYRVYFLRDDYTKPDVWTKEILYPHAEESLVIKANPVGSADYYFYAEPFSFHKSKTESGYWESPPLSPKIGAVYKIMTRKGERPEPSPQPTATLTPTKGDTNAKETTPAKVEYPQSNGPNLLIIALVGTNIVLIAIVVILSLRRNRG